MRTNSPVHFLIAHSRRPHLSFDKFFLWSSSLNPPSSVSQILEWQAWISIPSMKTFFFEIMVFFNVLNCVFFLLGDFSRITIIGWHIDTFLHCRVFFFFNLFSFAEIQIDLSNLKIQSQYCPICFSSDIKYIHNVPKHHHYPSSWFIPCSTGKP